MPIFTEECALTIESCGYDITNIISNSNQIKNIPLDVELIKKYRLQANEEKSKVIEEFLKIF
jgi:hypothetical protein